ncbi:universal stress protein [Halorubrum aethiopicum]|uniref:universal stress protein n=1 Tax=Halorubrum aethiopicum TaxID=1758255 RepID=UPI00082B829D|nr:universal stress protein [Halorubrum aethiopicum]
MTVLIAVGETEAMNRVVPLGYELAEKYDDTVTAFHVVPRSEFEDHKETIESSKRFHDLSITQEKESAARFARRAVRDAVPEFENARVDARGAVGEPADEIVSIANEIDPRYLVLGGRRRSPVGKALFGSITQDVLLDVDCPVVTVMTD